MLPDMAPEMASFPMTLDHVGMEEIQIPFRVPSSGPSSGLSSGGGSQRPVSASTPVPAQCSIFVDLVNPGARGIHMSRLYRLLQDFALEEKVSWEAVGPFLRRCREGQEGLSKNVLFQIQWMGFRTQKSLVSESVGFLPTPQKLVFQLDEQDKLHLHFQFELNYSSTCPASAALSRAALADDFRKEFTEERFRHLMNESKSVQDHIAGWLQGTSVATPHAQRSRALINLDYRAERAQEVLRHWAPEQMMEQLEAKLGTVVQTHVRRVDEQEFARRNAQNLIFCEDAVRRLASVLEPLCGKQFDHAKIHVQHIESLHPHMASAVKTLGAK